MLCNEISKSENALQNGSIISCTEMNESVKYFNSNILLFQQTILFLFQTAEQRHIIFDHSLECSAVKLNLTRSTS